MTPSRRLPCGTCGRTFSCRARWRFPIGSIQNYVMPVHLNDGTSERCAGSNDIFDEDGVSRGAINVRRTQP